MIDLTTLPAPSLIESLDYNTIKSDMIAAFMASMVVSIPAYTVPLESDPVMKVIELAAYRELLLRQRINNAAVQTMLPYATGSNLDNVASSFDVQRLVISPQDNTTVPPTPAVMESDASLRNRAQMAMNGLNTAGSINSYKYHALSSSGLVKDVDVYCSVPGTVMISVLANNATGILDANTLNSVFTALNADDVRPLCDTVMVNQASIMTYTISASIVFYDGVAQDTVMQASQDAINAFVSGQFMLGRDINLSGIYAALNQTGVMRVDLTSPVANIVVNHNQAALCSAITLTNGGIGV